MAAYSFMENAEKPKMLENAEKPKMLQICGNQKVKGIQLGKEKEN